MTACAQNQSDILSDIPIAYPPGLGYGAWRTSTPPSSRPLSYPTPIGTKRSRPPLRSNRRAPPPPAATVRTTRLLISQPEDPFTDSYSSVLAQDENNIILYKSSGHTYTHTPAPLPIRIIIPSPNPNRFNSTNTTSKQWAQEREQIAKQRAAADKEARLKVIASILLNRVNVVGKPMRRRPGVVGGGGKEYVKSSLGRCVAVAE